MLPLFVTLDLRGGAECRLRSILKELRRDEFARFTLLVDGDLGATEHLEKRGLPYELVFTGAAPAPAVLRHLEEVVFETDDASAAAWIDHDVPTHLQLPLTPDRVDDVETVVEGAVGRGFASVRFTRVAPESKDLTDTHYRELSSRLATMLQEGWPVAMGDCLPYCHTPLLFNACSGGVHACVVRADGGVYPCRFSTRALGHLDDAPLRWIWSSSALSDFEAGRAAKCDRCPLFSACRSGCRAGLADGVEDPLIKGFKSRQMLASVPEALTMDQTLRVRLRARRCTYPTGDLLVDGRRVMPIEPRWQWLMGHLEKGDLRLGDVRSSYSEDGLALVFNLYLDGYVRLEAR